MPRPAYCLVMLSVCIGVIFIFSPPLFLPVDPETDAAARYIYDPADQPFAAEQQGKQTTLDHPYIAYSFFLMLALEFCYCCS